MAERRIYLDIISVLCIQFLKNLLATIYKNFLNELPVEFNCAFRRYELLYNYYHIA